MKKLHASLKLILPINRSLLLWLGFMIWNIGLKAQILNPSDPIITYNSANPPTQPNPGIIGKWVITPTITGWNDSTFKAYIYNGMAFRLQYPSSYKPGVNDGKTYPLIIMFHGLGEAGTIYNNDRQLYHGGQQTQTAKLNGTIDAFCLFPQNTGGQWGPTYYQDLQDITNYMVSNCKVDAQRITAHGLSAGGQGIWSILNTIPKWLAAAIPMSAASSSYTQGLNNYKFTPIWLSQGAFDTDPLPSTAQSLVNSINAVGGSITYSYFPLDGHDTWDDMYNQPNFWPFLMNANKANPTVLFGRSAFCSTSGLNVTLGITPGFDGYQWKRNDTLISGAISNSLVVNQLGTYSVRYLNGSTWSTWSPVPAVISIMPPTVTPAIVLSRNESNVYPSPDTSKGGVTLTVPGNFIHYYWVKAGTTTVIDTNQVFVAKSAGQYQVTVAQQYGCSGTYSPIYTVVSASGSGAPSPATNLTAFSPSLTSVKLSWVKNTSQTYNNTGFEVYRASTSGGPYTYLGITPSDTVQFLDKNLLSNKTYYYIVRAVNNNGASANSPEVSVLTQVDNQAPTAPSNLSVLPGTASTTLQWNASSDNVSVAGYYIYVNGFKSYTTSNLNFTLYGLTKGQSYYFSVRAFDPSGNISPASNQVSGTILDNGLNYTYYNSPVALAVLPNFNSIIPTGFGNTANPNTDPVTNVNYQAILYTGTLHIPVSGNYTFQLSSNAGSDLFIDQPYSPTATPTINNDGTHGTYGTPQATLNLSKGDHSIALSYFSSNVGYQLYLTWLNTANGVGSTPVPIPDSIYSTNIPGGTLPLPPLKLMASGSSYNKINLSWADSMGSNQTGIQIFRSTIQGGPYTIINTLAGNSTSYVDSIGLNPSTLYYYKIQSINNSGSSAFTNSSSAGTLALPKVPKKPYSFSGLALSTSKIQISWTDSIANINTYQIYRSVNDSLNFQLVNTLNVGKNANFSYIDSTLIPLTNYYYKVLAQNPGGNSPFSNTLKITTLPLPPPPFTAIQPQTMRYGSVLNLNLYAKDPSGAKVSFAALTIPKFAVLTDYTDGTGSLNLSPGIADTGKYTMILKASSIYGSTYDTIPLIVNKVYQPTINPIPSFTLSSGDSTTKILSAVDVNQGVSLFWSFTSLPTFVTAKVNSDGTISLQFKPKITDTGSYIINANVSDGIGGTSNTSFGITVNNSTVFTYLNFGDNGHLALSPWNNTGWNLNSGTVFKLNNQNGVSSGTLTLLKTWSGTDNNGVNTGNNSGIYPDLVTQSSFSYTGSDTISVQLGGLDQTLLYDLNFFSSWANPWSGAVTTYAVGSTQVSLDGKNNSSKTVSINGLIPDANGNIIIKIAKTSSSANALLGALVFKSHSNPNLNKAAPTSPINLAVKDSLPGEKLSWVNTSTNATGIQVYRTGSTGDTTHYSLLTPTAISSTATSYLDLSAMGNATYYYKINSLNAFGTSGFSNQVKVITANKPPIINSIANQSYTINTKDTIKVSASPVSGSSLNLTMSGLFGSSIFKDLGNGTGYLALSPLISDTGKHTLILTAKDSFGGTSTSSFTVTISGTTYTSTYINFGDNNHTAPSPWNNTGYNVSSGTNFNLLDQNGKTSGTMTLLSNFGAPASGVNTGNNSGVYPDLVTSSSFSYSNSDTAKIQISGLSPTNLYDFTFFSSWSHPWSGAITDFSIGSTLVSLDGTNNSSNTVSIKGVAPNAAGIIIIKMAKDINAASAFINAIVFQSYTNPVQVSSAPTGPNSLVLKDSLPGVKLNWVNTANNATSYQVYRATVINGITGTYNQVNPGSTNPNQNSYLDTSARGKATYSYKVTASNSVGASPFSNIATLSTVGKAPIIAAISNVSYNINTQDTLFVSASVRSGSSLSLSMTGLFGTAHFTDLGNGDGYLILNPVLADSGNHILSLKAMDSYGDSSSLNFKVYISGTVYTYTYINFGDNGHMAPSPWNNTGYRVSSGNTFALTDQNGKSSGTMTLLSNFGAPSTGANTGNNSGVYPDAVISSAFSYSNSDTAKIQISGLNVANLYNFSFFSSWSHPWSGAITDFIIGSNRVSLDGTNNTSQTVSIKGISPDANGVITLKILKDINSATAFINALVFQSYSSGVSVPPSPPTLLTAHGSSTSSIKLNWVAASNANLYYIYRASASTGPYSLIDSVGGSATSYLNTGLPANTGYFYELKSKNNNGVSLVGNIAYATSLQYLVDIQFDSDQPEGAPWNSFNGLPSTGLSLSNLTNTVGGNSGLGIAITHNFDGANTLGAVTGSNSGIYPDKVIRGQFYVQTPDSAVVSLYGLSLSSSYDLVFFNSWQSPFAPAITSFTVNGITVNLNPANNSSNTVQINNLLPNSSGIINIVIKAANGSTYGILSSLVVQAHQIPPNVPNVTIADFFKDKFAFAPSFSQGNIPQAIVYPVPFKNNLNISLKSDIAGQYKISILDLNGELLYTEPYQILEIGQNYKSLNSEFGSIRSGIYILKIESDVFPTKTIKITHL